MPGCLDSVYPTSWKASGSYCRHEFAFFLESLSGLELVMFILFLHIGNDLFLFLYYDSSLDLALSLLIGKSPYSSFC